MEILAAYGCGYVAGHSWEGGLEYFQRFVGGIATNDYKEIKDTVPAVSKTFFIFALLFLLFDLEILLIYPYVVSAYTNGIYGLLVMIVFFLVLTLGFAFELGKNALKIESRQIFNFNIKSWNGYSLIYK